MNSNGVIWYAPGHRDRAREELNNIIEKYKMIGIRVFRAKDYNSFCEFDNGDIWRIASAEDCSRGIRGNIHYVDRSINIDVLKTIIMPIMTTMPFSSWNFYGEGDLHIADNKPIFAVNKCEFKIDEYANRPFKGK